MNKKDFLKLLNKEFATSVDDHVITVRNKSYTIDKIRLSELSKSKVDPLIKSINAYTENVNGKVLGFILDEIKDTAMFSLSVIISLKG